jgi:hypothetical protein
MQTVYELSIRREIMFPAGTDIQIQVVQPTMLKQKEKWAGWPLLTVDDELRNLVTAAPMRTATPEGVPSDRTNLSLLRRVEAESAGQPLKNWMVRGI